MPTRRSPIKAAAAATLGSTLAPLAAAADPPFRIESELGRLVETAAVGMALFDREMRYLAASPVWVGRYRLEPASLLGRSHYDLFPELPARWIEVHRRALEGETSRCDLDLFVRQDGSPQWLRWSVSPWRDPHGSIGGLLICAEDVTENRQLRSSLDSAEATIATLFGAASFGIAITDSNGRFLRANAAYERLLGHSERELQRMCLGSILHPESLDQELAAIGSLVQGKTSLHESRCRLRRLDGTFIWADQFFSAMPAHLVGNPQLVVCARDASERFALETRLRESDRLASVGMLGAGLGHDMKSVLFAMRCGMELSGLGAIDGATAPAAGLRQIGEGIRYLEQLSDGLQALVIDPAARRSDGSATTNLAHWWTRTGPLLRRAVPRAVRVEAAFPEHLPPLRIASAPLCQAMLNLIANAGQAVEAHRDPARRGGVVRILGEAGDDPRRVRLMVIDDGIGMSHEVRQRAFEPFFTTKAGSRGTGLGLSMVKRIIDDAGGTIEIDSAPDRGTRMTLLLPTASRRA